MRYISLLLLLLPLESFAACTPDTIQFYLDKGFSHEQVTKLCAESGPATPKYEPYQKPTIIYANEGSDPGISSEERRAITQLKGGVDARSIEVTDDSINYIRRICVIAGNTPSVEDRVKKCIDVAFSISRTGLQVIESGAGLLLFGQQEVELISSSIIRKHVTSNPFDGVPPDIKDQLKRKYEHQEKGNETIVPVRKSASPPQIVSALRTIAAATESRRRGDGESEVSRVLDKTYVPPTQEQYLEDQPTYDEIEEEENKKKKWWNPFD